ncbi:universal stress protein UspA (plasmid) [Phenylobacterium zucineum HLK1]|uniref:Universal stress protein UspA n=1 Tax=Phenylobacterium zucineum (strain HLK1) TaxID=450851 RepID=B4RI92_PHEZH|nr:universal stress protein [Phenylobacterium zucineum]ACG80067.1 universal stress protein UspA [Phenylobacterium zucineum HLK1]
MSVKQILVQAGVDQGAKRRVQIAADLAARFEAEISGVFLSPAAPSMYLGAGIEGTPPAAVLQDLTDAHSRTVLANARAAKVTLEGAARGKAVGWREIDGASPNELIEAARTADLLIMPGPPENTREGVFAPADTVALAAGGPVIAVPDTSSATSVGRNILVAWNGSRESARALRDALPLLTRADQVAGVIVDHPAAARDGEQSLEAFLRRHGCRSVSVQRLPEGGRPASEVILQHAAHVVHADLIVMGLYGHSRFREFILGGVSREMLDDSPIPLLFSH